MRKAPPASETIPAVLPSAPSAASSGRSAVLRPLDGAQQAISFACCRRDMSDPEDLLLLRLELLVVDDSRGLQLGELLKLLRVVGGSWRGRRGCGCGCRLVVSATGVVHHGHLTA